MSEKSIETFLANEEDARIFASRWAFLLELGSTVVKFRTKLQAARMQINDKVEIKHEKFYDRLGGGQHKIAAINSIRKNAVECEIDLEDLGNAFSRVCFITNADANKFLEASESEKLSNGYITDSYGLINNDEKTFGKNLIW